MIINYAISIAIRPNNTKTNATVLKVYFAFGIIFNAGLLVFFKYADFFIANVNQISNLNVSFLRLAIPLAISFYTLQQITYLIGIYHNEIKDPNFLDYSIYITFFPRLLMGPITRYNEVMPQFQYAEHRNVNYRNMSLGLYLFFIGLCKRVVISDTFGIYADLGHATTQSLSLTEAWITSLSYTFQIYFDFSGYTDMAIGTAYFFNIKLPFNFNSPYLAVNIQDFWRRWHITLSRFLRDYIYIPLGGSRQGEIATYTNIMITFLIGGLWHGTGWTFIIWGGIHGVALCIYRIWHKFNIGISRLLAIFVTFNIVNVTWVFFRAKSLHDAINVLKSMIGLNALTGLSVFKGFQSLDYAMAILIGSISVLMIFTQNNSNKIPHVFQPTMRMVMTIVAFIAIGLFFLNSNIPKGFIYNDF